MSKSDFDAFVRRQQTKQQEATAFDPQQQLDQWLGHLDTLYRQITEFLNFYVQNGSAQIEYQQVQLNEEFIGPYTARKMLLKIGRSTITFLPIATMLIGAKGRVDVQGARGSARLLLVNKKANFAGDLIRVTVRIAGEPTPVSPSPEEIKQIEWSWKLVTPPPESRFIELAQEEFFKMVLLVADV
jgi:hypothetical protein